MHARSLQVETSVGLMLLCVCMLLLSSVFGVGPVCDLAASRVCFMGFEFRVMIAVGLFYRLMAYHGVTVPTVRVRTDYVVTCLDVVRNP